MPITTPLPTPPASTDPTDFNARTDAFLAALVQFQTELNNYAAGLSPIGRNRLINGAMMIDQRNAGASVAVGTSAAAYVVDRWSYLFNSTTTGAFSLQQVADAPAGLVKSLKATVTTADTTLNTADYLYLVQAIEGYNFGDLNWGSANAQSVTLSFWVKSSLTGVFSLGFRNNAGNRSYVTEYTIVSANVWQYVTVVIPGDQTGTWLVDNSVGLSVDFALMAGATYKKAAGSWGAGNFVAGSNQVNLMAATTRTFQITGVQLEAGVSASPFEDTSHDEELARCQRYYEKTYNLSDLPGTTAANSELAALSVNTSQQVFIQFQYKVKKRIGATINIYSTTGGIGNFRNVTGNTDVTAAVGAGGENNSLLNTTAVAAAAASLYACQVTADAEL